MTTEKHPLSGTEKGRKILNDLNNPDPKKQRINPPVKTPPLPEISKETEIPNERKVGRGPRWGQRI